MVLRFLIPKLIQVHFARVAQPAEARRRERRQCQCESDHEHQFMESKPQQTGSTQDRTALGVQVSPRRPIWNVNRTSEPGLGANECVPPLWDVAQVHGIPPFSACSSKRTGGFISRIALDQCRVRERYPARRPFLHLRARRSSSDPHAGHESVKETDRRCDALSP